MDGREKVIEKLESLRDICNAKSNMAAGNGKIAWAGYANAADDALALLKKQEPKRGRWVEDDYILVCSECEGVAMQRVYYSLTHNATDIPMVKTPYCPHCGARMERSETDAV